MILVEMGERRSQTGRELQETLTAYPDRVGVVNWTGANLHGQEALTILNARSTTNKLQQLLLLSAAELPTVQYNNRSQGLDWLPRRIHHQQGYDFTNRRFIRRAARLADFWVKKEEFTDEFRVHVFLTKRDNVRILRVAKRVPATDDHHPWVRSHRLGWRLSYVGGAPEPALQASRAALRALHLDFGAVDLGIRGNGSPCILEVNTCPGLEGGCLDRYCENIVERFTT
jgi:hypothetical protein